jgi:hypothetical protein
MSYREAASCGGVIVEQRKILKHIKRTGLSICWLLASGVGHVGLDLSCVWRVRQGSERRRGQRLQLGGRWARVLDNQKRRRGSLGNMDLRWSGVSANLILKQQRLRFCSDALLRVG